MHDLSIGPSNLDSCFQAFYEMRVRDSTANCTPSACTAIVRALWGRLRAIIIEAIWNFGILSNLAHFHQSVLLLNAIPCVVTLILLVNRGTSCASVTNGWLIVPSVVRITNNHDMRITTERIIEESPRLDVDFRVV